MVKWRKVAGLILNSKTVVWITTHHSLFSMPLSYPHLRNGKAKGQGEGELRKANASTLQGLHPRAQLSSYRISC